MPYCRAHLRELFDRVANLLVEDPAIRNDDDGIEHWRVVRREPDQLVREPGDRVRLAAAGRPDDRDVPLSDDLGRARQQVAADDDLVRRGDGDGDTPGRCTLQLGAHGLVAAPPTSGWALRQAWSFSTISSTTSLDSRPSVETLNAATSS